MNDRKNFVIHLRQKSEEHAYECFEKLMTNVVQRSFLAGMSFGLFGGFLISLWVLK